LNLTGVIKESGYSDPHGLIRLQVDGENGKTWRAVLAPPSRMNSRGLSQEMLKVGTTATVIGYPHREVTDEIRAERTLSRARRWSCANPETGAGHDDSAAAAWVDREHRHNCNDPRVSVALSGLRDYGAPQAMDRLYDTFTLPAGRTTNFQRG
jgi:Family of unknown function (DUF6152)